MGVRQCKPVVEYSDALNIMHPNDLLVIKAQFARLAGPRSSGPAKVAKAVFVDEVLRPRFPGFSEAVLDRAFAVLDYGGSGAIEQDEFVVAVYVMQLAPRDDRMQLIFNLYDLDANGQISKKELKKMSVALAQPAAADPAAPGAPTQKGDDEKMKTLAPLAEALTHLAVYQFDRNADSMLNMAEWYRYADDDPAVTRMLDAWDRVKFDDRDVAAAVRIKEKRRAAAAAAAGGSNG